jgi:hypothetical protein
MSENTALAAAALAHLSRDKSNEEGLLLAANPPDYQAPLFRDDETSGAVRRGRKSDIPEKRRPDREGALENLDVLTDHIIKRGFLPEDIGRAFIELAQGKFAIERSTAFSAIIAKALEARRKRNRK